MDCGKVQGRHPVMTSQPRIASGCRVRFAGTADLPAVRRFNARLAAGGVSYQIPGDFRLPGEALHRPPGYPVFRELMIAEDASEMRAGVLLQHGTFFVRNEARPFSWLQLPLSEGLINPVHARAFLVLMLECTRREPFLGSLGVGAMDEKWARFLVGLGWKTRPIPFFFYPVRPNRVFLGLEHLRRKARLQFAARAAVYSGAATALGAGLALRRRFTGASGRYIAVETPVFDSWADNVFFDNQPKYGATPRRDSAALNILYPPSESSYVRLRVQAKDGGRDIGWVLLVHARMRDNKYFGDLHVGTIVTGFGDPADAPVLIHAGLTHLIRLGADLVVGNWSHSSWQSACRGLGFLPGPSNFLLFLSPGSAPLLSAGCPLEETHLTRGDCDSPSSLMPRKQPHDPRDTRTFKRTG